MRRCVHSHALIAHDGILGRVSRCHGGPELGSSRNDPSAVW